MFDGSATSDPSAAEFNVQVSVTPVGVTAALLNAGLPSPSYCGHYAKDLLAQSQTLRNIMGKL